MFIYSKYIHSRYLLYVLYICTLHILLYITVTPLNNSELLCKDREVKLQGVSGGGVRGGVREGVRQRFIFVSFFL